MGLTLFLKQSEVRKHPTEYKYHKYNSYLKGWDGGNFEDSLCFFPSVSEALIMATGGWLGWQRLGNWQHSEDALETSGRISEELHTLDSTTQLIVWVQFERVNY